MSSPSLERADSLRHLKTCGSSCSIPITSFHRTESLSLYQKINRVVAQIWQAILDLGLRLYLRMARLLKNNIFTNPPYPSR